MLRVVVLKLMVVILMQRDSPVTLNQKLLILSYIIPQEPMGKALIVKEQII